MFVLYKCILYSFVNLRNISFPLDQSNVLEHGTKTCKSEEQNAMLFSKKITDQLTSDLSSLLLTFKIRGNKDSSCSCNGIFIL